MSDTPKTDEARKDTYAAQAAVAILDSNDPIGQIKQLMRDIAALHEENERLERERDEAREALLECYHLLARYREGVPLGHQPHMIAHEADEALDRARAILAKAKP